jgi:recombination protein RecR
VQRIPEPLKELVDQMARLPGLGPKSAMRAAMSLLKWPETEVRRLGKGVYELRDTLHLCSRCGALSDSDPCPVCADASRDAAQLCLVAEWDSMLTMEEGNFYRGLYFILGGLLAPLDNSPAGSLEMERLYGRLAEGEVRELILALGATADAEATASYVREQVGRRFPGVRVSRLAQGIPLGAEVRFMDRETLRQSLRYRQEL